jgi:hypothetical protein
MATGEKMNTGIPDVSKNNEEILQNIQLLQNSEQELMNDLENNPQLTSQQQQKIIQKIQQLTDIRSGLYTTLSDLNSFYKTALTSSTGTLKQQSEAINIVETELNRTKQRLQYLETEKNNKIRLVEINEYYGDKYSEHTSLMKIIIFTLIPIIILTFIYNKGFLPSRIYYLLFIIVGVVGAIYFWKTYASIITRDNMNYDAYNWAFDPKSAPKGKGTVSNVDPWAGLNIGTCIGQECCQPDQIYNTELDQCVTANTSNKCVTAKKEPFEMPTSIKKLEDELYAGLSKLAPNKYKADVNLKESFSAYNS